MIQLDIQAEHCAAYLAAMTAHAHRARQNEPGTMRFDVITDDTDPNRIYIYEAYVDRAALDVHNAGTSIAQFREETKGLSATFSRLGRGTTIFPPDGDPYWHT